MKEELNRKKSKKMKATFKDYEIDTGIDWSYSKNDEEYAKSISQIQDAILLRELKENGLVEDFHKDKDRRFKKFMLEQYQNIKTIYYDDGSIDGKIIVRFETKVTMGEKGVQIEVFEKSDVRTLKGKLSKKGAAEMLEQIGELREEWQRFCECEAPLVRGYGDDEYCGLCQKRFIK